MAINRYYYPTKYESRNTILNLGVTCVFISHQKRDRVEAKKVADYLLSAGVDVYFDEYDGNLKIQHQNDNPKAVTKSICNGINNSSHMIVVVSKNTVSSSWVPFEIGYGYDKTDLFVLTLKGIPKGSLPEYLRSSKIIRDIYDLNSRISEFTKKNKEILLESRTIKGYNDYLNPLIDVMDGMISGDV